MEHVHAAGIIHRDLKPANLLLVEPYSPPPPLQWQTSRGTSSDIDMDHSTGGGGGRVAATDGAMDVSGVTDTDSRLCSGGNSFRSSSGLRVQIADFGIADLVDGHERGGAAAEAQGIEFLAHAADKIDKPSGGFYKRMMVGARHVRLGGGWQSTFFEWVLLLKPPLMSPPTPPTIFLLRLHFRGPTWVRVYGLHHLRYVVRMY